MRIRQACSDDFSPPCDLCRLLILLVFTLSACGPAPAPLPAPTLTASPAATATATPIPTGTPTAIPTPTSTPEPAWYQSLDPAYGVLKYHYALVTHPGARVYPSLQDAVTKSFNYGHFPNDPAYVAYYKTESQDGRTFYALVSGNWMDGQDLQDVTPSAFSGILLTGETGFRFGWVLTDTQSVDMTGKPVRSLSRYQIVHAVPAGGEKPGYAAIGADEWLPESSVAWVRPQVPEEAGRVCRFIYVSLPEQTLSVYSGCKLVFATLISSGTDPRWTFPGQFAILNKYVLTTLQPPAESTSRYYLEGVPYFMPYAGNWGFHGAYWHDNFGTPASHGCINLSPADASWLYEWAEIGDYVFISGH